MVIVQCSSKLCSLFIYRNTLIRRLCVEQNLKHIVLLSIYKPMFVLQLVSKASKGVVKKSIFASPESVDGRVGIGTCGVSGKPMTHYQLPDKLKKLSQ